jgi:phosphoglucomutase
MRGIMGVGTNRLNKYTLGQATQGLANYLHQQFPSENHDSAKTEAAKLSRYRL